MGEPRIIDRQAHPAFQVLYDAYRAMGCPAAVDPVDPDDCASVADESVRVLFQAGLLAEPGVWAVPPEPGPEVKAVAGEIDPEVVWRRCSVDPGLWETETGVCRPWGELVYLRGPLTEVVDTDGP